MDVDNPCSGLERIEEWFRRQQWQPFDFQRAVWQAWLAGRSGLLHAPSGSGKTLAVLLGPLAEATLEAVPKPGLRLLWITPMRALAHDTVRSLFTAVAAMAVPWRVGERSGDTTAAMRARQDRSPPQLLVVTPESLALMLSHPRRAGALEGLSGVVVDEWHELVGTKRGVQVELALAWLRTRNPGLRTWGLAAALGNPADACAALLGRPGGDLVQGGLPKRLHIGSQIPPVVERFPWGGRLGLSQLDAVIRRIEAAPGTLVVTNHPEQAELWCQALRERRPDWAGQVALHHGALDRAWRAEVEHDLRSGRLRCVVCTSELRLGVDLPPVAQVLQVGSPKEVARLAHRAGRSGHGPGQESRILCVPTHALELLEAAAARLALEDGRIEARTPLRAPLDVLLQHLVTLAAGPGFAPEALLAEVRGTSAYADLDDASWQWALKVLRRGDPSAGHPAALAAVAVRNGRWHLAEPAAGRRHRMRLSASSGDRAGELPASSAGTLPFSRELAEGARNLLDLAARLHAPAGPWPGEHFVPPELHALDPVLKLQARWSALPPRASLLAEFLAHGGAHHLFLFPFEGRRVHAALAAWLAWRLAPRTGSACLAVSNDFGLGLASATPIDLDETALRDLLGNPGETALVQELQASGALDRLARQHFAAIARRAGLDDPLPAPARRARGGVPSGSHPEDAYTHHGPDHPLVRQARCEALGEGMDLPRLLAFLDRLPQQALLLRHPPRVTPFAFPLLVEYERGIASGDALASGVAQLQQELEQAAGNG